MSAGTKTFCSCGSEVIFSLINELLMLVRRMLDAAYDCDEMQQTTSPRNQQMPHVRVTSSPCSGNLLSARSCDNFKARQMSQRGLHDGRRAGMTPTLVVLSKKEA